jgi:hypothetical protein
LIIQNCGALCLRSILFHCSAQGAGLRQVCGQVFSGTFRRESIDRITMGVSEACSFLIRSVQAATINTNSARCGREKV